MHDAVLVVSFGGPEREEDVLPFLENVTRGRNIPRERLLEVAEHYYHFGGKSPINAQNRELIAALQRELQQHGNSLPVYWGNRNWHPLLPDTLRQMREDGVRNALAYVTSAYSSYSGCTQYRENIAAAQEQIGEAAPEVHKLRAFYNHPLFIEACADRVRSAARQFASGPHLVVTAHSIPSSMAQTSDYQKQLEETARLTAEAAGLEGFDLVYQSRSGPPLQPWLEPDVLDHLRALHARGVRDVVVAPLGFLSDHMEILFDLDTEAAHVADELGMKMVRAQTVGTHPAFISMIRELIDERLHPDMPKRAIGRYGPNHDVCSATCCPAPPTAGRVPVSAIPIASQQT